MFVKDIVAKLLNSKLKFAMSQHDCQIIDAQDSSLHFLFQNSISIVLTTFNYIYIDETISTFNSI